MEIKQRKTVFDELNKYCHLAKDDDFIEVTEWTNGEGYDISMANKSFSVTIGELEAILYLTRALDYNK